MQPALTHSRIAAKNIPLVRTRWRQVTLAVCSRTLKLCLLRRESALNAPPQPLQPHCHPSPGTAFGRRGGRGWMIGWGVGVGGACWKCPTLPVQLLGAIRGIGGCRPVVCRPSTDLLRDSGHPKYGTRLSSVARRPGRPDACSSEYACDHKTLSQ